MGLGVGVGVGVPMFAALAGIWFLLWKERMANRELRLQLQGGRPPLHTHDKDGPLGGVQQVMYAYEMPAKERLAEMRGTVRVKESAGENVMR